MEMLKRAAVWAAAAMAAALARGEMPVEFAGKAEEILREAAEATAKRYPDADAVMLLDAFHTKYEADGTYETWNDEWVKILTEKGRRAYATLTVEFNERYGTGEIQEVEIWGADGKARKVDFRRLQKTATDNSSMGANITDPLDKKTTCAAPGLAVGEVRHARTKRTAKKARMRDTWADLQLMEYTAPVKAIRVSVDQPAGRGLAHAVVRNPNGETCRRLADRDLGGGRKLAAWEAKDVPQVFTERNMPPLTRCAQTLYMTTVKDWRDVSKWYWEISKGHLEKTTPEMTNEVARLTAGCKTREERIAAVFRFVSQEVRYMGLTLEDTAPGYEPHDVDVTFSKRYGVCRDKAALLAAMLRIAGEKAYPVLIHASAKMDAEAATPYFNHAIAAVENPAGAKEKYTLMDPTDETTRDLLPAYLNDKSYLVAREEGEGLRTSGVPDVEENMLGVESRGKMNADGTMALTTEFKFGGINDTALRGMMLKRTAEERRRWFENLARGVSPGAEVLSLEWTPADLQDTKTALGARATVMLRECTLEGATRIEFAVPLYTKALSVAANMVDSATALEKRRFPLVLPVTAGTRERLRVDASEWGGGALKLPEAVAVTNAAGYAFRREFRMEGKELVVEREMRVEDVNFTVDGYFALREASKRTETAERKNALFAHGEDDGVNVRHLTSDEEIRFWSARSWTSTNRVEKEVLTYAGKKSAAELKLSWNPLVGSVEVVGATVSNRNGKVHAVTGKEVNVMDCGWAASAPRYPAGKILVVNLPGVEVGSVVRYSVVRTVTNSPVAWTRTESFRSGGKVDFDRLTLHLPEGVECRIETGGGEFKRVDRLERDLPAGFYAMERGRTVGWAAVKPERIPKESGQAGAGEWTPTVRASMADWEEFGAEFAGAMERAREEGGEKAREEGRKRFGGLGSAEEKIEAARKFMAEKIRVAGPGWRELPFGAAFGAPDRALEDGYASGADWINLMHALLEGAGLECDLMLADNAARTAEERAERAWRAGMVGWYDSPVVRAREAAPWWAPWREGKEFWVGMENEYTPAGATGHLGERYLDPVRMERGRIGGGAPDTRAAVEAGTLAGAGGWAGGVEETKTIWLRENGSADIDVTNRAYGAGVGTRRKIFAEMLPEWRERYLQRVAGLLAKNATATSEFRADTEGYPMTTTFSVHAPDFAVAEGGAMTVRLPWFSGQAYAVGNKNGRETPIAIGGANFSMDEVTVVFPEGYEEAELLPEEFEFGEPSGRAADCAWTLRQTAEVKKGEDGRVRVTVRRVSARDRGLDFAADYYGLFRERNRRAESERACTITMRKKEGEGRR